MPKNKESQGSGLTLQNEGGHWPEFVSKRNRYEFNVNRMVCGYIANK
jgi:hypothetical protein